MNKAYNMYMKEKWAEAERIAVELGVTSNQVVCILFDKLCQPYYYWNKIENK